MQAHPLTLTPPTCIGLAAAHACEFALEGGESALHLGLQLAQVHDQLLVVRDAPHSGRVVVVRRGPMRRRLRPTPAAAAAATASPASATASAFPLVWGRGLESGWVKIEIRILFVCRVDRGAFEGRLQINAVGLTLLAEVPRLDH